MARHKVGGSAMKKPDVERLAALEDKAETTTLDAREEQQLHDLTLKLDEQQRNERPCPFRTDMRHPTCTKPGGVCSLQLLSDDNGQIRAAEGERGMLRALCPYRFHQDDTVFRHIGEHLLDDPAPKQVGEVGFLESTGNLDSAPGENVGRIDMILYSPASAMGAPAKWAAVEIQAVYFSGREMGLEFRHLDKTAGRLSMAQAKRRPDYRSSGPKRLMPQLQIKVPTLRRWGKKMGIVVDIPFFMSMGNMRTVENVSNADIVWYLVDFRSVPGEDIRRLEVVREVYTTLEDSIEGLTGGVPVSLDEFEKRIASKIS
ncbi:hypothetical protein GQ651_08485 [Alphaproteobacteria bacterium GH1-50]|uniref:Restriction endonuclease type II NotI domain-containing protein n=1 Tax=Kangsaoukella pontilimi TaxID=2691042 RepID=A0A7C9J2X7_9RHOB|nr:NotI family restriction endonuclease [Kangsaoukella pontilimi]MXQ07881.1 hypothetical protein [Kangsaoukella pontilimi]